MEIKDLDFYTLREGYEKTRSAEIGDKVWVGSRATILKGVKIGAGSVITSGAIVTSDVPKNCLAARIPARIIQNNVQ